jgi:hypothetical protein
MAALLDNDWFDSLALFVLFALPGLAGIGLVARDACRALGEGRIAIGSRLGRDTAYDRQLQPAEFWGTLIVKAATATLFFSLPLLVFVLVSLPHWRSIANSWHVA